MANKRNHMGPQQFRMFSTAQRKAKNIKENIDSAFRKQVQMQREGQEPSQTLSREIQRMRVELKSANEEVKSIRQLERFENKRPLSAPLSASFGPQLRKFRKELTA